MADVVSFAYGGAGSEAEPPRQSADWVGLAGGGLIGAGLVLGLIYAWLIYRVSPDGADQVAVLLQAALATGVLAASAGLVLAGSWPTAAPATPDSRARRKACGALLGAGLCAVFAVGSLSALADVIAGLDTHVPYSLLGQTGWLPIAAGSGLSLARKGGLATVGRPGRPRRANALPLALLAISVAGALVTVVPPWIRYTVTEATTGAVRTELFSNAFAAPGVEIAGTVGWMIVIVAMVVAAALWRPARFGAVFLTGAVLYLADMAIAGIFAVIEPPPPAVLGWSQAQAAAARLTISVAGTPWMWAYCGFLVLLVPLWEWLFTRGRPRPPPATAPVTSAESAAPGTAEDSVLP